MSAKAWWGFDVDKTAFVDEGGTRGGVIGAPIMPIIRRIKYYLRVGRKVNIVSARVHPSEPDKSEQEQVIKQALCDVLGTERANQIGIRSDKDRHMISLVDDRVEQVIPNKGILVREELRRAVAALQKIAYGDTLPGQDVLVAQDALSSLDQWSRDLVRTAD
jgi:hypothetical protein